MIVSCELEKNNKMASLDNQPSRERVLPYICLLTESEIFSESTLNILKVILTRLRDKETSNDAFRYHIESLTGFLLWAMLSPKIKEVLVTTPLGEVAKGYKWDPKAAVFYINRAGAAMGMAAAAFLPKDTPLGELDIHRDEETLKAILEGYNLPSPEEVRGRKIVILDPMNATAGSILKTYKVITEKYKVNLGKILVGNIVSAPFGVKELIENIPHVEIYTVALDEYLTQKGHHSFPPGYIVPGLGDAGDRCFGEGRSSTFFEYQRILHSHPSFSSPGRLIWPEGRK